MKGPDMEETQDLAAMLQERIPPFAKLLGMRFISAMPERVVAEMIIRDDLCTTRETVHGGAIMAFADTLGACATVINLQKGFTTSTLESKTNFFAPAPANTRLTGVSEPLHRGKRTHVWQTRLTSDTGRLVAVVTQTQMVLEPKQK
jgi:uncharacterized protein (TIGR00369 family)